MYLVSGSVLVTCLLAAVAQASVYYNPRPVVESKPLSAIPVWRRQYACTRNNLDYYEHGDVYRISYQSRCITYRCELGTAYILDEGCLDTNQQKCVPVNYTWVLNCHTFLCSKRTENGYHIYEGIRSQITCYDPMTDTCKENGETFDTVDEAGIYRRHCTCRILPGRTLLECLE